MPVNSSKASITKNTNFHFKPYSTVPRETPSHSAEEESETDQILGFSQYKN